MSKVPHMRVLPIRLTQKQLRSVSSCLRYRLRTAVSPGSIRTGGRIPPATCTIVSVTVTRRVTLERQYPIGFLWGRERRRSMWPKKEGPFRGPCFNDEPFRVVLGPPYTLIVPSVGALSLMSFWALANLVSEFAASCANCTKFQLLDARALHTRSLFSVTDPHVWDRRNRGPFGAALSFSWTAR